MNINLNCYFTSKQMEFAGILWKDTPGKKKMITCHLKLKTRTYFISFKCQLCYSHTYRFTITDTFTYIEVIKVSTFWKLYKTTIKPESDAWVCLFLIFNTGYWPNRLWTDEIKMYKFFLFPVLILKCLGFFLPLEQFGVLFIFLWIICRFRSDSFGRQLFQHPI